MFYAVKNRMIVQIPLANVDLIIAEDKYLTLFAQGVEYLYDGTTIAIIKQYPNDFIRISRGIIVKKTTFRGWFRGFDGSYWLAPEIGSGYPIVCIPRRSSSRVRGLFESIKPSQRELDRTKSSITSTKRK